MKQHDIFPILAIERPSTCQKYTQKSNRAHQEQSVFKSFLEATQHLTTKPDASDEVTEEDNSALVLRNYFPTAPLRRFNDVS